MNLRRFIILLSLSIFVSSGVSGQNIRTLTENQILKQYRQNHSIKEFNKSKNKILLTLPFFEDFSNVPVLPDPLKWTDEHAFINNSFGLNPISIGVATLDAIDKNGDLYSTSNASQPSDTLTSAEIDLLPYVSSGDKVIMSFFYQCGGKGETPEIQDSLWLEYYFSPNDEWVYIWSVKNDVNTAFTQTIIEIADTFYTNNFRFRFRNVTSLSPNDVAGGEGALSNADCWNLDYIMINTNPLFEHQSINDVALTDQPRNLLRIYESVPWNHLNQAQDLLLTTINFDIRSMQKDIQMLNIPRNYYVKNLNTGEIEESEIFEEVLQTDTLVHRNDDFIAAITKEDDSEEGAFEVVSYLITPGGQYKNNDTSKTDLHFANYYAFDDGSPEYGFGIEGPSTYGALLAMRFRLFKDDTLQAVQMFFNKTRNDYNADLPFQICIWENGGNGPGDLIYMSSEVYTPGSSEGYPAFKTFPVIDNEALFISDTVIYIGWKQLTEDFINLGYDVNRDNRLRTYFNVTGEWNNASGTLIPGSLMIRPVFGKPVVISGSSEIPASATVKIYPNPANDFLYIDAPDNEIVSIAIADMMGKIVMRQKWQQHSVDVTGLLPGFYQVIIETSEHQTIIRKLIISR